MNFGKDFCQGGEMADTVEDGAALAWRVLATLEGGSLLLAMSALFAYTMRKKLLRQNRRRRTVKNVLITNTANLLGRELKRRLEAQGCVVETTQYLTNGAGCETSGKVDAIIMVGAEPKTKNLDGIANLVTEDVYDNLRLLDTVSPRLQHGGYVAWACSRDKDSAPGPFRDAEAAFDTVLQASLTHIAKLRHCYPVWVGRCEEAEQAAERTIRALLGDERVSRFSVRNTAHRIGEFFGRWLKIVT